MATTIAQIERPDSPEAGNLAIPSGLDPGIRLAVEILMAAGIETFESCQGGDGHSYPEPTVRFHGERPEGFKALSAAMYDSRLKVSALRRIWRIIDGEPSGPYWEIVFVVPAEQHANGALPNGAGYRKETHAVRDDVAEAG